MEIDKKRIVCWSKRIETNYTYYDDNLGELKVKVIDILDDDGEHLVPTEVRIRKDNYYIPELTRAILNKHLDSQEN